MHLVPNKKTYQKYSYCQDCPYCYDNCQKKKKELLKKDAWSSDDDHLLDGIEYAKEAIFDYWDQHPSMKGMFAGKLPEGADCPICNKVI